MNENALGGPIPGAATQSNPPLECDLVMKGGVTSGIVYPRAILKLKDRYRFRNIGGTSAGAIAAAFSAAAEYGRETGGFTRLEEINQRLAADGFLIDLFQPSRSTKPLLDLALGFMEWNAKRQKDRKAGSPQPIWKLALSAIRIFDRAITGSLLRPFVFSFLIIGLVLILTLNLTGSLTLTSLMVGVLLALLSGIAIGVISSAIRLWKLLMTDLPTNNFGICTGLRGVIAPDSNREALIDFLHESIQTLAGRSTEDAPLTFGDLARKEGPPPVPTPEAPRPEWGIQLNMMTTNLSQNQPYILPFTNRTFIFKKSQFEQYFPAIVVKYLTEVKPTGSPLKLPDGYHVLPDGMRLPVLVAVRMSLSFPLLFCAIPLYTVKRSTVCQPGWKRDPQLEVSDLQENWFSDGGITSNFPIHFFDAWLPSRPTFGITLTEAPAALEETGGDLKKVPTQYFSYNDPEDGNSQEDQIPAEDDESIDNSPDDEARNEAALADAISIQKANAPMAPQWFPFYDQEGAKVQYSLSTFLASIFTTAQNYRDDMQAMLPSYRERIVRIRLGKGEGGLNLGMDNATIQNIMGLGDRAGDKLCTEFDFAEHQWVRLRVLADILEEQLGKMEFAFKTGRFDYRTLMNDQCTSEKYPYRKSRAWCEKAEIRLQEMRKLIAIWQPEIFNKRAPNPRSILRVSPRV